MTTMRDVAHQAGVSVKTVSRVVNKDRSVRAETAARVSRVIQALDYVPDPAARMMRRGRSGVLGLISDDVTTTTYAVEVIRGVQDACAQEGILLLISNTRGQPDLASSAARALVAWRADGLIFATRYLRVLDELPTGLDVTPVLLVNCVAPRGDRPSLVPDDFGGSHGATTHLIALGHRNIGLVSINPRIMAAERRAAGFKAAMADHGLIVSHETVQSGQHFEADGEPFTVAEAVDRLLAVRPGVTAILCGTDAIAMRVGNVLRARGLRVPQDMSVVGFDNFLMIVEGLDPPLTTVALPYYEMGRAAVAHFGRDDGQLQHVFPCPLVVRESCGPPREAATAAVSLTDSARSG